MKHRSIKTAALFLLLFSALSEASGQRPSPDKIDTSKGALALQPLNHATMAMTWQGTTVYTDPNGGARTFEGVAQPDLILITDIHGDHFNPETLNAINTSNATLVVPQAVADKLPADLKDKCVVLRNGQTQSVKDISITGRQQAETYVSLLANHSFRNETITAEIIGVQSVSSGDGFVRPSLKYQFRSNVIFKLSGDVFYGSEDRLFGQFSKMNRIVLGVQVGI